MDKIKERYIYKSVGDHKIGADLYPNGRKQSPLLIYIHGGALIFGSREDIIEEQVKNYIKEGFSVLSIDYRLAPESKLKDIVLDIRDALEWARVELSKKHDIDTGRIAVIGSSAGAYLALMTGLFKRKPRAIVSFYGYGSLLGRWANEPDDFYRKKIKITREEAYNNIGNTPISKSGRERWLYYLYCRQQGLWAKEISGYKVDELEERLLEFAPLEMAGKDFPPTLLLHGTEDRDVPYYNSLAMKKKLDELQVDNDLLLLEGKEHEFDYLMEDNAVQEGFKKVLVFLHKYLK